MALGVRWWVTFLDDKCNSIVVCDQTRYVGHLRGRYVTCWEIWSSNTMPVDNSAEAEAAQRQGFVKRYNYVGNGQGTVIRITQLLPGGPKFMHRTETLDYAIILSGECDLELDDGKTVHLKERDVVIQRGTMHAWINNGTAPCVFAFILIDAEPAEAGGETLRTHYPAP